MFLDTLSLHVMVQDWTWTHVSWLFLLLFLGGGGGGGGLRFFLDLTICLKFHWQQEP